MDDDWNWDDFTEEELSAVLSLVANGEPFCCEAGRWKREAITDDLRKLEFLAAYAYEATGCTPAVPDWHVETLAQMTKDHLLKTNELFQSSHDERWERYFDDLVEAIGDHVSNVGN